MECILLTRGCGPMATRLEFIYFVYNIYSNWGQLYNQFEVAVCR